MCAFIGWFQEHKNSNKFWKTKVGKIIIAKNKTDFGCGDWCRNCDPEKRNMILNMHNY